MSDWHMYELEGIVCDEFRYTDEHIVPHPGDELVDECASDGDFHKKPWREIASPIIKSVDSNYAVKTVGQGKEETTFRPLKDIRDPMMEKSSWSHLPEGLFSASCDSDSIKEVTTLASVDTRISGHCLKTSNLDSIGNEYCADDNILSDSCAAVDSLCRFPIDQISHTDNDLEFFSNSQDKESSDLLYYEWPDIGNFEDVDTMLRSCDSTFGQGNDNNNEELFWISSSSHAFDGSEDALKSGFKSSCSKSNILKSTLEHHEDDSAYMANLVTPSANDSDKKNSLNMHKTNSKILDSDNLFDVGHSSYGNWDGAKAETKGEFTSKEQAHEINGEADAKMSPTTQTNNDSRMINLHGKKSKYTNQSGGRRKDKHPKYLTGVSSSAHGTIKQSTNGNLSPDVLSAQQVFLSPGIQQQKQNLGPESTSYLHTYVSYANPEFNDQSNRIPLTPESSIIKSKNNRYLSISSKVSSYASNYVRPMERSTNSSPKALDMIKDKMVGKFCQQQDTQVTLSIEPQHMDLAVQAAFADHVPVQKQKHEIQNEDGYHAEVGVTINLHGAQEDSLIVRDSSCMSSTLDEISLEAISFRQLQCVMEQLDVRTKLCIRDSLYRLARSAEERNSYGHLNCGSGDSREKSDSLTAEESNKCTGFLDMETDTNPIDRSIAHLLFHRPWDRSTMPANVALSLESRKNIHGSVTGPPLLSEKLVFQEKAADVADTNF